MELGGVKSRRTHSRCTHTALCRVQLVAHISFAAVLLCLQVPDGWREVPVSIADLGGTEVQIISCSCIAHCLADVHLHSCLRPLPSSFVSPAGTLGKQATLVSQIDLRFGSEKDGNMAIVVAPVLRFLDVGFNSDVRIQELGSPEKLISGFGPELFGSPLQARPHR